jgi:hypothetical protein
MSRSSGRYKTDSQRMQRFLYLLIVPVITSLSLGSSALQSMGNSAGRFGEEMVFRLNGIGMLLVRNGNAAVAVVPAYQERVIASSAKGEGGYCHGWLNYKVIRQGVLLEEAATEKLEAKIRVFGGEKLFCLGSEGGQFDIFLMPSAQFDFVDWKTLAAIDTELFDERAVFAHSFFVADHSGIKLDLAVESAVRALGEDDFSEAIAIGSLVVPGRSKDHFTSRRVLRHGPVQLSWARS